MSLCLSSVTCTVPHCGVVSGGGGGAGCALWGTTSAAAFLRCSSASMALDASAWPEGGQHHQPRWPAPGAAQLSGVCCEAGQPAGQHDVACARAPWSSSPPPGLAAARPGWVGGPARGRQHGVFDMAAKTQPRCPAAPIVLPGPGAGEEDQPAAASLPLLARQRSPGSVRAPHACIGLSCFLAPAAARPPPWRGRGSSVQWSAGRGAGRRSSTHTFHRPGPSTEPCVAWQPRGTSPLTTIWRLRPRRL